MKRFNLRDLRFDQRDEAWRQLPVDVEPFRFGGQEFAVDGGTVDLDLLVARVGDRLTLTGSFSTALTGPCQRCLEPAVIRVSARGTEIVLRGQSEGVERDEAYAMGHLLDLEAWVRDLIASALPDKLVCREDCRGLCPVCGVNLNEAPGHGHT